MYIKSCFNTFNSFFTKILSFLSLKYKLIDDLIISIEYIYIKSNKVNKHNYNLDLL